MKSLAVFEHMGLAASSTEGGGVAPDAPDTHGTPGSEVRHLYHHHVQLWDYCNPALARPFAAGFDLPEVFASPPPGTSLEEAMGRTRFLVFLGAGMTPELKAALDRPHGLTLVFEPSRRKLDEFLSGLKPWKLAKRGVFFVAGNPDALNSPLLSVLPDDLCDQGYPLFFAREGLPEALPEYTRRVEELLELFYYRNVIYSLDSQDNIRGLPLRPMVHNYIYDRLKHHYENLELAMRAGVLSDLPGAFTGATAILCAAGPALQDSLDFVRDNQDRALVIAVNSSLKPLLAAGIEPHFVVINDTSTDSEPTLAGLPSLAKTNLVAHCLSTTGGMSFPRTYLFGNFPGQPFQKRASLLLHGSVITTAFALAEYLGCARAVLAGVQLGSPDPWALNYTKGSLLEAQISSGADRELINRWPQLYPVMAADGRHLYTTLNFFDSAQWFADRIRMASLEVINLNPASILKGPKISFDPAPPLPEAPGLPDRLAALPKTDFSDRRDRVLDHIRQEMARWKGKQLAARQAGQSLEAAAAFIAASDQDNTSFMLQRFEDFDNASFHAAFFDGKDDGERMRGAAMFLEYMARMCQTLLKLLLEQHRRITARA
jgi:hypothetical protein